MHSCKIGSTSCGGSSKNSSSPALDYASTCVPMRVPASVELNETINDLNLLIKVLLNVVVINYPYVLACGTCTAS